MIINKLNPGKLNGNQVQGQQSSDNTEFKNQITTDSSTETVGQSDEDKSDVKTVETLLAVFGERISKRTKYVLLSYVEAKKAGLKVAFIKGNRKVYNAQITALYKSAKPNKKFQEACRLIAARPVLEAYPNLELVGLDGNYITKDAPDLDCYFIVEDGQHRITCCELHSDVDVELEIDDFDGQNPIMSIRLMNSYSRNWSCNDLRDSNEQANICKNPLYEDAAKLQYLYGITTKLAEYVLTFNREATRKKDLVEGKTTTTYNETHAERGKGIYNAAMTNFGSQKELKKLEFMDAVVSVYNGLDDSEKPVFARNMKLCLGTLSEDKRNEIVGRITAKDYGTLNHYVCSLYNEFCKKYSSDDLAEMESNLDSQIESYTAKLLQNVDNKAAKSKMKTGYVYEIINQNKALETKKTKEIENKKNDNKTN